MPDLSWLKFWYQALKNQARSLFAAFTLFVSITILLVKLGIIEVSFPKVKGKEAPPVPHSSPTEASSFLGWKNFLENLSSWDTRYFYSTSTGVYCLRSSAAYDHQFIWYKEPIGLTDNHYLIKFKVNPEKGQEKLASIAKVVFAFGKQDKISEFFLPAFGDQVINFLQTDPGFSDLKPKERGRQLMFPVQENTTIEFVVETTVKTSNLASFVYRVTYIPKGSDRSFPEDFSYSVRLDDPSGKTQFGVGIYGHGCIQPQSYLFN